MLVQAILKSKPSQDIITISPESPVSEAVSLLSAKRIGTVVVSDNGTTPDGVLSERDIVRELGRRGSACLKELVGDMMTKSPVTCTPEDTADKVLAVMTDGRFRHMPVMDNDRMVGVISIGDVVKARLDELSHEKDALQDMIMGR